MGKNTDPAAPLIIMVDDEPEILFGSSLMLRQAGFSSVLTVGDSRELLPLLAEEDPGVVILDLQMPHLSGGELLGEIAGRYPHLPVIIVTAANELDTAIECMKRGAVDYMVKPIEANRFIASVRKALEISGLRREIDSLRATLLEERPRSPEDCSPVRTRSSRMKTILRYLEAVAPTSQPVLITGETGVGKELAARAVHDLSGRRGGFVAINSAGLDDLMFADTLFGHKKGAFSGADQAREGMIARAGGGTLFLDEIGDLSSVSQIKLLRLLQEGEYYPLGSDLPKMNHARIVVATNRNLAEDMESGRFRSDLYYRLFAHHVLIPPLRERLEDIPLLLETFIEEAAGSFGRDVPDYPYELVGLLSAYPFPGNIRELRAMVFDAMTCYRGGKLSPESFRNAVGATPAKVQQVPSSSEGGWLNLAAGFPTLKEAEHFLIEAALSRSSGNQRAAADLLGISRQALNQRLRKG